MQNLKKVLKISSQQLNLENTLVNGQCFNWTKLNPQKYKGIFRNYLIILERLDDEQISFLSSPKMTDEIIENEFLKEYLQIPQIDVESLYKDWADRDSKYFKPISVNLPGVRCLRQDPWECTLSFICSSNNNIKRITQLVNALRSNFGSKIEIQKDIENTLRNDLELDENQHITEFTFPSLVQMEKASEQQLRDLGFGYRAQYLTESVQIIKQNGGVDWLNNLRDEKDMNKIKDSLISLKGVGKKVAYCIQLFSMDCPGIIPVDTHVFQLAQKFGFIKSSKTKSNLNDQMHEEIGNAFRKKYGQYAGWAHQILFAGDLSSFQSKLSESKEKEEAQKSKKRNYQEFQSQNQNVEENVQDKEIVKQKSKSKSKQRKTE